MSLHLMSSYLSFIKAWVYLEDLMFITYSYILITLINSLNILVLTNFCIHSLSLTYYMYSIIIGAGNGVIGTIL